jgi:hypothetical protein
MEQSVTDASKLGFEELDNLRQYLEVMLAQATPSLSEYWSPKAGGFLHQRNVDKAKGDFSRTSTATCVAFLVHTGRWSDENAPWSKSGPDLIEAIVESDWDSAQLGEGNPFTTSFLLEAVKDLEDATKTTLTHKAEVEVNARFAKLEEGLIAGGGIPVQQYPPTSFMTQKALRVVTRRHNNIPGNIAVGAARFAWAQLRQESIAASIGEPDADVFELGYAVLIASQSTFLHEMSPRERDSIAFAIDQFFDAQRPDGTWPRSQPLFLYPTYGNAYCYEYEFLVQLLSDKQLQPMLLPKVRKLAKAAHALDRLKIPIGTAGQIGWPSGHLKKEKTEPESWSTASAFHFCHTLHRLIGEAIRRHLFSYVRAQYVSPSQKKSTGVLSAGFLDTPVDGGNSHAPKSLTDIINQEFIAPLHANSYAVRQGQPLPSSVATSVILYGPPGTSKTKLSVRIADALGWPLLKLDPSHLTRNGLDALHAEANRIFTMLEASEELVVLLDEFDELVRERDEAATDSSSRFLTTAMLPKLAALSERRRIVYLLATNHLERFDIAISREGRFDFILPVAPPTLNAKLERWPNFKKRLRELGIQVEGDGKDEEVVEALADLTYSEFDRLQVRLDPKANKATFLEAIKVAHRRCTLLQKIPMTAEQRRRRGAEGQAGKEVEDEGEALTWKQRLMEQRGKIRTWQSP